MESMIPYMQKILKLKRKITLHFLSINSDSEDLMEKLKEQNGELKKISSSLQLLRQRQQIKCTKKIKRESIYLTNHRLLVSKFGMCVQLRDDGVSYGNYYNSLLLKTANKYTKLPVSHRPVSSKATVGQT